MRLEMLFNYTEQGDYESGLRVARIVSRRERNAVHNRGMVPTPPNDNSGPDEPQTRVCTYVDVYGEYAYLFIEENGAGVVRVTEILEFLENAGIDPYQFEKIAQRHPDSVTMTSTERGYKVTDKGDTIYFSMDSDSNPQKLN